MRIKPTGWEFSGTDFCCAKFKMRTSAEGYDTPDITVSNAGTTVFYKGYAIDYCPFCGTRIELEKVGWDGKNMS